MIYILLFILGLVIGSFLNCVIFRLEKGKSFLKGRSFCPFCNKTLGFWDLIPGLSFLFLRGKCRYCKERISWQYPLVELFVGIIFVLVFKYFGLEGLFFYLLSSCFLVIIFVFDLKHYIIPDRVIYPAVFISFFYRLIFNFGDWHYLLSGLGAALFFLIIVLASKGKGMGVGDIKLGLFMGFLLGYPNILIALFIAFLIGAIIGLGLVLLKKKKMRSEVPFGPFLAIGTFASLFWAAEILSWYWNLFNIPLY